MEGAQCEKSFRRVAFEAVWFQVFCSVASLVEVEREASGIMAMKFSSVLARQGYL